MSARAPMSGGAAVWALAQVTWTRLVRGRALWIALGITVLPVIFAPFFSAVSRRHGHGLNLEAIFQTDIPLLCIVPPMFAAASLGEEIEDRTAAYLWSRPIPRWAVLAGKLAALAPIAILFVAGAWIAGAGLAAQELPSGGSIAAFAAGALAASVLSAAMGALRPNHGMALAICYLLALDFIVGVLPSSIQQLTITHHVRVLGGYADGSALSAVIGLSAITAFWGWIAVRRMNRLEV